MLVIVAYQTYFLLVEAPFIVEGLSLMLVPVLTIPAFLILLIMKFIYYRLKKVSIPKQNLYSFGLTFVLLLLSLTIMFQFVLFYVLGAGISVGVLGLTIYEIYYSNRPDMVREYAADPG